MCFLIVLHSFSGLGNVHSAHNEMNPQGYRYLQNTEISGPEYAEDPIVNKQDYLHYKSGPICKDVTRCFAPAGTGSRNTSKILKTIRAGPGSPGIARQRDVLAYEENHVTAAHLSVKEVCHEEAFHNPDRYGSNGGIFICIRCREND